MFQTIYLSARSCKLFAEMNVCHGQKKSVAKTCSCCFVNHKEEMLSHRREYDRARQAWETAEQREGHLRQRRERDKDSTSKFR